MASIKQLNKKISSLRSTRKITRAMKMIAATKLRKAQEALAQSKPYEKVLNEFIARLSAGCLGFEHRLFQPHEKVQGAVVAIFTSDRGLCGSFNNNLIKKAAAFARELTDRGTRVEVCFFGRRGFEAFRKREFKILEHHEGVISRPSFAAADKIGTHLIEQFLRLDIDEVYLVYNEFRSSISQVPVVKKLLPFTAEACETEVKRNLFLFEPEPEVILTDLAFRSVKFILYRTLLMSATGEMAARMTAMDSATNNCEELIDKTTLLRNKVRQAAITKELVEIVSGAESV